jgi:hypothetical protein
VRPHHTVRHRSDACDQERANENSARNSSFQRRAILLLGYLRNANKRVFFRQFFVIATEPLVIATSKFSGKPAQRTLLVVRQDDQANNLDDLEGSTYGYLNRSCSSSFFPPAIMLHEKGKKLETFFELKQVAGWQDRLDAVVAKSIRATMILEDAWNMYGR